MMSGIKGRDTKIELLVRKALHARGLRYRLHNRSLPGRPDMAFASRKTVVFVNGCFWHGHDCPLFRLPASNTEFWRLKIGVNRERDLRSQAALTTLGWRSAVVWECAMRGEAAIDFPVLVNLLEDWIRSDQSDREFRGTL